MHMLLDKQVKSHMKSWMHRQRGVAPFRAALRSRPIAVQQAFSEEISWW